MIPKLLLALLVCLSLSGCEMEKVPEMTPEQIENERYESILDKFRVEPTDYPVSTCLDVEIDNLDYDSEKWTLELPKINSSKPVAEKLNETIFTKYTERFRGEIEELTETRKTAAQHKTWYDYSESKGFIYIEITVRNMADDSEETETIYYDSTNDKLLDKFEFFDALIRDDYTISDYIEFINGVFGLELTTEYVKNIGLNGSCLELNFNGINMAIPPEMPIPSEVQLPDAEPMLERAPSISPIYIKYYSGDGTKFYWSRTGKSWYDFTIELPDGAENPEICALYSGNSGESSIILKATMDGETVNFAVTIAAYLLPPIQDDCQLIELGID